jgi:hypothetical protein
MNQIVFLILILLLAIGLPLFFKNFRTFEGFSDYTLAVDFGEFPSSTTSVLVQDTYPVIEKKGISNDSGADIWSDYPIFTLGSYDQITNNIRYPDNPDEGTCMPASMCGALYHKKNIGNNYVEPLPPVNTDCNGARVGYFDTYINMLPFRTDKSNILY